MRRSSIGRAALIDRRRWCPKLKSARSCAGSARTVARDDDTTRVEDLEADTYPGSLRAAEPPQPGAAGECSTGDRYPQDPLRVACQGGGSSMCAPEDVDA